MSFCSGIVDEDKGGRETGKRFADDGETLEAGGDCRASEECGPSPILSRIGSG
jgi:hypothetical protein